MNDNKKQWWERFWADRSPLSGRNDQKAESWTDLVWQVCLEELSDLIPRHTAGRKMLECGCGLATVSTYMAKCGYDCTMLDYSNKAIDLAKASFANNFLKGEFTLGDMNNLPFADDQFDVVYSGGVLEFFDDISNPLREIVRVLKPGGFFVVNIVPNKFSCQTLADLECTLVHSLKNLLTFRWRKVFVRLNHLPPGVSHTTLKAYILAFESAGLNKVVGHCITPFPALSLGRIGGRTYARLMKYFLPQWRRFNRSRSFWSEIFGMAYTIYGTKPEPLSLKKESGE